MLDKLNTLFRVTCLSKVNAVADEWNPNIVLSFLDPNISDVEQPVFSSHIIHKKYYFFDQESVAETLTLERSIIECLVTCKALLDNNNKILIHCHAGASRSPAMCYVLMCNIVGINKEEYAFKALLQITTKPWPNRRIVEISDSFLRRDGRMLLPLDRYRELFPHRLIAYRKLNKKRGISTNIKR